MLSPKDFTNNGDALSGIITVPGDEYPCVNDVSSEGSCTSGEMVNGQWAYYSYCIVSGALEVPVPAVRRLIDNGLTVAIVL